jgi:hypothetical protein
MPLEQILGVYKLKILVAAIRNLCNETENFGGLCADFASVGSKKCSYDTQFLRFCAKNATRNQRSSDTNTKK